MHIFYETADNPVPDNATGGFFAARDGKNIRYALFAATGRPVRGTVIVVSGRNECIEKYFETIADLSSRGFGCAILDWRGQGGSDRMIRDRRRGYVRSFDQYADDFRKFFQEIVLPDCRGPFYILAHSAGALVVLLAAPALANRVRRMVLMTPFLALPGRARSMDRVRRFTGFLCMLGLGRLYAASGSRSTQTLPFAGNSLTSDLARYRRNSQIYETYPQLGLRGPTFRWVHAAARASQAVRDRDFMATMRIPTLIVAAGADRVVSTRAIEDYARHLRLASLVTIEGAQHELPQEADLYREQLLAAFDAFIPGSDDIAVAGTSPDIAAVDP